MDIHSDMVRILFIIDLTRKGFKNPGLLAIM